MKKLLLSAVVGLMMTIAANAQIEQGRIQIETGFSPFTEGLQRGSTTGLALFSVNGTTLWSVGFEGGYFIQENLALKAGFGYIDFDSEGSFSYKIGAKYYVVGVVPLQLDITGATREDIEFGGLEFENPDPLWLGLQAGYAIFLTDNISFEPSARYNISLNTDAAENNIFELRMGFAFLLN